MKIIKNILKKIIPKSTRKIIKEKLQILIKLDYIILFNFYKKRYKLNNNKILFFSMSRETISGNFLFIYNELKKYNYETNFILKKSIETKFTFKEKKSLCKELATSKYILIDDFLPIVYILKIRKNQELIQVWHAMGAFKTFGYARLGKEGSPSTKSLTHRNYTKAIVSSPKIKKNYADSFGIDIKKIYDIGIPRTDIFFDKEYKKNVKESLYKKYKIPKDKKIILFAPTFRGNGEKSAQYDFNMIDFNLLKEELKKEYFCIIKLHPFTKNKDNAPKNDDFYLDLTSEREINDLLFITDILVTDYSSVIFENALLNNRVIFFVPDIKEYINSRDFYYDFSKYTYGDVTYTTEELINSIKKEQPKDIKKLAEFKDFFCSSCDGKSSKRFVEELIIKR